MEKLNFIDFLAKKNNDFFRTITDKHDKRYLYDTQINTARKIISQLGEDNDRKNHVILTAKMQSGKTGVCNAVVNMINKSQLCRELKIFKYFFITGMNDCGLKNQTYNRIIEQIEDANIDNIYLGKHSKRNLSTNKYFVLKNSDLMKFSGNLDNSLIFVDESHYGSNKKNILTKFFEKNNIDWKDKQVLKDRNIYIVSISATPFDELVSDKAEVKKIITIDTDKNYYGVTQFFEKGNVFDASKDDFENGAIFDYIEQAFERMKQKSENGIVIIRTRKFDIIENNEYVMKHFNVFKMFSNGDNIEYEVLNNKMQEMLQDNENYRVNKMLGIEKKPLLVLIKGAFRAGITINEEYKKLIYLVYDYSLKADATAQALLGRLCGYRHNDINPTYFFINKDMAKQYSDWENDFQNKSKIPSDKMKYEFIDDSYVGNDVVYGSQPCGNFTVNLTKDEIITLYNLNKTKNISDIENYIRQILTKKNQLVDYDYLGEMHLKGKNHYAQSSQDKRFNDFSPSSLVFQFRPNKIKKFMDDTQRDYLNHDDLGKKCISFVLDAIIETISNKLIITGNQRLLVYYVKVGQKKLIPQRKNQYKPHKDTSLL